MSLRLVLIGSFAAVVAAVALFAIASAPDRMPPWNAERQMRLQVDRFASPSGDVQVADDRLVTKAANAAAQTIVLHDGLAFDAGDYRFMRFDLRMTPPSTRPLLLWNTPGGLRSGAVPWHSGPITVDLARLQGWEGEISALGLALVPLEPLSTAASADRRLELGEVSLSSDNRRDAMAALWGEWIAYRPWGGRSINTGGFALPIERGVRPTPALAIIAAVVGLALWLAMRRRAGWRVFAVVVLLAWVALDLMQLRQLHWRGEVAAAARAGAPADEPLTAQPTLAAPIARLIALLDRTPAARVIVHGDNEFSRQYPAYLLRGHDVATLPGVDALPDDAVERGAVLVLFGAGTWRFDPARGVLQFGERTLPATLLLADEPVLQAYRLGRSEGTQ